MENAVVTKEMLIQGLKELGLKEGMKLMVHSSLKSFGTVEGGPDSVIDAIIETIGTNGTLLMPSFNHGEPYDNGEIFDVNTTKTIHGIIPETFRKRKDVVRFLAG